MNIHYLLTPDKAASRMMRRAVAEQGARLGVIVGTWPELVSLTQKTYLLPILHDEWKFCFNAAVPLIPGAFWLESLKAAQFETADVIENALVSLIKSIGPKGRLEPAQEGSLPHRLNQRLTDLARLHEQMGFILPADFTMIRQILHAQSSNALNLITVYHVEDLACLTPWQKALLEKLARDCPDGRDQSLDELLHSNLLSSPCAAQGTSLHTIQTALYDPKAARGTFNAESVQYISVRDTLEEFEIAAGMIQKALKEDSGLTTSDFALLLPLEPFYHSAARYVFSLAGLPLSGLPADVRRRDIGCETVYGFLTCCRKPLPVMAYASLLSSPLMPWCQEEGRSLSQSLMDGRKPEPSENLHKELILLIDRANLLHGPKALAEYLERFTSFLACQEGMEYHHARTVKAVADICVALRRDEGIETAFRMAMPDKFTIEASTDLSREGIAVFNEHEESWRKVRRLFVLGFREGYYPSPVPRSSVFFDDELKLLCERFGYELQLADEETSRRRSLFKRQLAVVSESLVCFSPGRDLQGKPIAPSSSLPFMAALFNGIDGPENLLFAIATEDGLRRAKGIACAAAASPKPPRELTVADLHLDMDLLGLRRDDQGNQKPESPSGLEKLMVSPLAWLIDRAGLKPREWKAEVLDVATKGTLAHDVFEHLFLPHLPIPEEASIPARISGLLCETIRRKAPFLERNEWHIECSHLTREIGDAASFWSRFLNRNGATILGNEVCLRGDLDGIPICGCADLLLALPGNRLLVVDYKKSSSTSRRERMLKHFDSQTNLYRIMLETGGDANNRHKRLAETLAKNPEIGVLYCLLNDCTILADTNGWLGQDLAGVRELAGDVSSEAMKLIRDRIQEVRRGMVALNKTTDEKWYEKSAGIKLYALDDSPLVRLFMHPVEGGAE